MTDKVPVRVVYSSGNSSGLAEFQAGETVPIANGGTGNTTAADAINALLPSQTNNSGKYLTTNGSVASWESSSGVGSNLYLFENFT